MFQALFLTNSPASTLHSLHFPTQHFVGSCLNLGAVACLCSVKNIITFSISSHPFLWITPIHPSQPFSNYPFPFVPSTQVPLSHVSPAPAQPYNSIFQSIVVVCLLISPSTLTGRDSYLVYDCVPRAQPSTRHIKNSKYLLNNIYYYLFLKLIMFQALCSVLYMNSFLILTAVLQGSRLSKMAKVI